MNEVEKSIFLLLVLVAVLKRLQQTKWLIERINLMIKQCYPVV